jgi:hypothetical protein
MVESSRRRGKEVTKIRTDTSEKRTNSKEKRRGCRKEIGMTVL